MASRNTVEALTAELIKALRPFRQKIKNPDSFKGYLRQLGWDYDIIPSPINNLLPAIDNLDQTITSILNASANPDEYIAAKDAIKGFSEKIIDLQQATFPTFLTSDNFAVEFPQQLIDFLIIDYLFQYQPQIANALRLFGILDMGYEPPSGNRPGYISNRIRWDLIGSGLSNPNALLEETYGWGTTEFNFKRLAENLNNLIRSLGIASYHEPVDWSLAEQISEELETQVPYALNIPFLNRNSIAGPIEVGVRMLPLPPEGSLLPGFIILPYFSSLAQAEIPVGEELLLTIAAALDIQGGLGVKFLPEKEIEVFSGFGRDTNFSQVRGGLKISLKTLQIDEASLLVGSHEGSRLSYQSISVAFGLDFQSNGKTNFFGDFHLNRAQLSVLPSGTDNFISSLMPEEGVTTEFDLIVGYRSDCGFYLKGSAGFEIRIPLKKSLGAIAIQDLVILANLDGGNIPITAGFSILAKLGPFQAIVIDLGFRLVLNLKGSGGNLGPVDAELGVQPPKGIGFILESDAVKGGGFITFDPTNHRYTGVLELSIKDKISVKAIGILLTQLPGEEEGFSLLLLISAEFPPIQLGFGFTLNGVGGLIGVHRDMNIEALRIGVRNRTLDNILFPQNPVANANRIISDLETVFPPVKGKYAFGLMGIIGWGVPRTIISIELGLIFGVPNPVRIAILGVLKMLLPDEVFPTLRIQVNFLGVIDFEKKMLTFDASLFDSRWFHMTLSGDMAVRMKWGSNPSFLLSVGGFHPDFDPPPLDLPPLRRITINLLGGDNPRLTLKTYFALTSNTVQFGSRVDFYYKITRKIRVEGFLGFDVLFQFSPFYFKAEIYGGLAVYRNSNSLLNIYITVMLEGPKPWKAKGLATFQIAKLEFSVDFDKQWGEIDQSQLPDVSVLPMLKETIEEDGNWETIQPQNKNRGVTLRKFEQEKGKLILQPETLIGVKQKVVPLEVNIKKFGKSNPVDHKRFEIKLFEKDGIGTGQDLEITGSNLTEHFAPNDFFHLNDSQKLSRPSFEKFKNGKVSKIDGGDEVKGDLFREKNLEYESVVMDSRYEPLQAGTRMVDPTFFNSMIRNSAPSRCSKATKKMGRSATGPSGVECAAPKCGVACVNTMEKLEGTEAVSEKDARLMMEAAILGNPELEKELQVIPEYELV